MPGGIVSVGGRLRELRRVGCSLLLAWLFHRPPAGSVGRKQRSHSRRFDRFSKIGLVDPAPEMPPEVVQPFELLDSSYGTLLLPEGADLHPILDGSSPLPLHDQRRQPDSDQLIAQVLGSAL